MAIVMDLYSRKIVGWAMDKTMTYYQYGAFSSTVIRRFDHIAEKEIPEVQKLPRVIAIDEYKGNIKEGKYQLIIADGERGEPINILPNC